MTPRAIIDFETRSACSLKKCGAWRYSIDPTTEVLCLAFRLPTWTKGRTSLWHPAFPAIGLPECAPLDDLAELVQWMAAGKILEAHNAWFERCIWENVLVPRFDFPSLDPAHVRCSATKAAAHALPRGLDDALAALKLRIRKDPAGAAILKKTAKPRKPRKAEREAAQGRPLPLLWWEEKALFESLFAYCRQDVLAEEALSDALPDLSPFETDVYLLDQRINRRGFQIDADAVDAAQTLIAGETKRLNKQLSRVTNRYVEKATQRDAMLTWFESQGVDLPDTQKTTIEDTLQRSGLPEKARQGLEIVRTLGQSSTAKYEAMALWAGADARIRGGMLYHGASTGRWSGAGVQPHNFPRGSVKDQDALWALLKTRNPKAISAQYRDVLNALSQGLRGAIIPTPGRQLYVADYAAIEARVLLWLADDQEALDVFRTGADIYCVMAESIYGYPCNKTDHPNERALGKVAVLGLGYQMGWSKFIDTCWTMARITIDETLAQVVVDAYREKFWRVKQMWWDQQDAAIDAVLTGQPVDAGPVRWTRVGHFLYCTLPSGRRLAYPFPEVRPRQTPWGEMRNALSYMGIDVRTRQWKRITSYGGMIVENITQAVARDLMAWAMVQCDQTGVYDVVLTVHDELVAEADLGAGTVHEFEQLVADCPPWATGCPVAAEGWRGTRYRK